MHVYEIDGGISQHRFYSDRATLQTAIRAIPASARIEVEIRLLDVSVAKVDVVSLLNGQLRTITTLRRWRLSNRGRMIEITAESND